MVGDLEKSSFSNIEQQSLEFVKYTLDPWVIRWEQALKKSLFLPDFYLTNEILALIIPIRNSKSAVSNQTYSAFLHLFSSICYLIIFQKACLESLRHFVRRFPQRPIDESEVVQ